MLFNCFKFNKSKNNSKDWEINHSNSISYNINLRINIYKNNQLKNLNCNKLNLIYKFININKCSFYSRDSIKKLIIQKKRKIVQYRQIEYQIKDIRNIMNINISSYKTYSRDRSIQSFLVNQYTIYKIKLDELLNSKQLILDEINDFEFDENMLMQMYDIKKSYINNVIHHYIIKC
jgi:hypothetical protein